MAQQTTKAMEALTVSLLVIVTTPTGTSAGRLLFGSSILIPFSRLLSMTDHASQRPR